MTVKPIITVPDVTLRKISEPIEKISVNEKKLIKNLFDTMYAAKGIGLAAIQIGIPKRIVVIDVSKKENEKNPICLINPKINRYSKQTSIYEEGCLSIPETFIEIERPKTINIDYIDEKGARKNLECDGLLSTCIQHEVQHCDGKLIIDFLSKLKKEFLIKKLIKNKNNLNKIIV
tara:strand:+ start:586 stop:1110 length:525 start_codon:yes stop_codon:yes gene_type:complete